MCDLTTYSPGFKVKQTREYKLRRINDIFEFELLKSKYSYYD